MTAHATFSAARAAAAALVLLAVSTVACTEERVTAVMVGAVGVDPPSLSVVEGEEHQLTATVWDEIGAPLERARVSWRSDDEDVATVDEDGIVQALAPGEVRIRASFNDVEGAADVRVLEGPRVSLSKRSVRFSAVVDGDDPEPEVVSVRNGGAMPVEGLVGQVAYEGAQRGWLVARVRGTTAPTELVLEPRIEGLGEGTYEAAVEVTAENAPLGSSTVSVRLELEEPRRGLILSETGGSTTVSEDRGRDEVRVRLEGRPPSSVVVRVSSDDTGEVTVDPDRLVFTRGDWGEDQTVQVRGVRDDRRDGDQVTTVRFLVDADASPPSWRNVPSRSVRVTTRDADRTSKGGGGDDDDDDDDDEDDEDDEPGGGGSSAGIVITETDGSTVVSEDGGTDQFFVVLEGRPSSEVVVRIVSADPTEVMVASWPLLRFTPSDWDDRRTVTLRGVDDLIPDGDQEVEVDVEVVSAISDPAYEGISEVVSVRNVESGTDEVAGDPALRPPDDRAWRTPASDLAE